MKTLYKFMRTGLLSDNGKEREWEIGKWRKEENIDICNKGFHASVNPAHALSYVPGEIIALVEVRGECITQSDKQCWSEMRIKKAWHWKKEDSVDFAIFAAEKVIDIFEKEYPNDDRPRKAIEAAKEYLKNPTKKNMNAAADAAYAAAYAARAAAYAASAVRAADNASAAIWKSLCEWMYGRIKTLEPYKK